MSKKSTEFFQSVRIFPAVFVRIFEKVIWEHWHVPVSWYGFLRKSSGNTGMYPLAGSFIYHLDCTVCGSLCTQLFILNKLTLKCILTLIPIIILLLIVLLRLTLTHIHTHILTHTRSNVHSSHTVTEIHTPIHFLDHIRTFLQTHIQIWKFHNLLKRSSPLYIFIGLAVSGFPSNDEISTQKIYVRCPKDRSLTSSVGWGFFLQPLVSIWSFIVLTSREWTQFGGKIESARWRRIIASIRNLRPYLRFLFPRFISPFSGIFRKSWISSEQRKSFYFAQLCLQNFFISDFFSIAHLLSYFVLRDVIFLGGFTIIMFFRQFVDIYSLWRVCSNWHLIWEK